MRGYVKIGDFKGDATDRDHKQWSNAVSISAPITHAVGFHGGSQKGKGQTSLGNVDLVKEVDGATVKIQRACAMGQKIPKVEIHICTVVGDRREPLLVYELEDVYVTSYSLSTAFADSASALTENLSLNFNKVTWSYTLFGQDGKKQGKLQESYKVGEHK